MKIRQTSQLYGVYGPPHSSLQSPSNETKSRCDDSEVNVRPKNRKLDKNTFATILLAIKHWKHSGLWRPWATSAESKVFFQNENEKKMERKTETNA